MTTDQKILHVSNLAALLAAPTVGQGLPSREKIIPFVSLAEALFKETQSRFPEPVQDNRVHQFLGEKPDIDTAREAQGRPRTLVPPPKVVESAPIQEEAAAAQEAPKAVDEAPAAA